MWKSIVIAVLTFSALITRAQKVKTYTTKEFQYRVCYTSTGGTCSVDSIIIFRVQDKQRIQRLVPPANKCYCGVKYDPLTIEDYNFDNHPDISIIQLIPATGKAPYFYWLYNVAANEYLRNVPLEQVSAPLIDKTNKCIVQEWKESETLFGTTTYSWIEGSLTKTGEVSQEYIDETDNETGYILETTKKLTRGKMKVVSKKKKKWEDGIN